MQFEIKKIGKKMQQIIMINEFSVNENQKQQFSRTF